MNPIYRYWSDVMMKGTGMYVVSRALSRCAVQLEMFSVLTMNNYVKGSPIRVFNENFKTVIL
jgi:hypothetical protein